MISENVKQYCKDDISKIENYELAIADNTQVWECHHRLGLTLDGEVAHDKEDLKRLGMYYNRPYFELIFLTISEHKKIHNSTEDFKQKMRENNSCYWKGKNRSEETKRKISEALKGNTISEDAKKKISDALKGKTRSEETKIKMGKARKGKTNSDFGKKFKEHFGITYSDDSKLYQREKAWYRTHNNKCRWEK